MAMIDVRSVKNPRRLLFRIDKETGELEIKQRGEPAERVNLRELLNDQGVSVPAGARVSDRTPSYR